MIYSVSQNNYTEQWIIVRNIFIFFFWLEVNMLHTIQRNRGPRNKDRVCVIVLLCAYDVDGYTKNTTLISSVRIFVLVLWGNEMYKQNYFQMQCIPFSDFVFSVRFVSLTLLCLPYSFYLFIMNLDIASFFLYFNGCLKFISRFFCAIKLELSLTLIAISCFNSAIVRVQK